MINVKNVYVQNGDGCYRHVNSKLKDGRCYLCAHHSSCFIPLYFQTKSFKIFFTPILSCIPNPESRFPTPVLHFPPPNSHAPLPLFIPPSRMDNLFSMIYSYHVQLKFCLSFFVYICLPNKPSFNYICFTYFIIFLQS